MFDALRQAWHQATHPFQGYLETLWEVWKTDVARATLMARQFWQQIPEAVVQQGAAVQAQANAANAAARINQQVSLGLGKLGIPAGPGIGAGIPFSPTMNPEQLLFLTVMANIRAAQGDPRAPPGLDQLAAGVLLGQIDPVQALVACTPGLNQQQLLYSLQAAQLMGMPQVSQVLRVMAVVQAAIALPHDQIASFLPKASVAPPS